MKFPVILIDWPWHFETFSDKGQGRAPKYEQLTLQDLGGFDMYLRPVMAEECVVFFWVTWPLMYRAVDIIESNWPVEYSTCGFNWVKFNKDGETPFKGTGYYTRANSEPCLIFRGKTIPERQNKGVSQIVLEWQTESIGTVRGRHSEKPEAVQDRIEQLFDGPYLELFARRERQGWTCLGNEISGNDIRADLEALTTQP